MREKEKQREDEEERVIFSLLVYSPNDYNRPGRSQQSGTPSGSATYVQGLEHLGHLSLIPNCTSRELDWKWCTCMGGTCTGRGGGEVADGGLTYSVRTPVPVKLHVKWWVKCMLQDKHYRRLFEVWKHSSKQKISILFALTSQFLRVLPHNSLRFMASNSYRGHFLKNETSKNKWIFLIGHCLSRIWFLGKQFWKQMKVISMLKLPGIC